MIESIHRSKLKKRLRDARDMLSMTSLTKERYKGVDLQNQQHVTIFLGACVHAGRGGRGCG